MAEQVSNYKQRRWDEERSLESDVDDTFHGRVLASFETGGNPLCFDWLVADYPGEFMRLIAHFPDRERRALIQRYVMGHSQPQRAHALGVSDAAAFYDLERAHRRLMQGDPQPKFDESRMLRRHQGDVKHTDPDSLGQFRVSVDKVADVCFEPSHIRIDTTPAQEISTNKFATSTRSGRLRSTGDD